MLECAGEARTIGHGGGDVIDNDRFETQVEVGGKQERRQAVAPETGLAALEKGGDAADPVDQRRRQQLGKAVMAGGVGRRNEPAAGLP